MLYHIRCVRNIIIFLALAGLSSCQPYMMPNPQNYTHPIEQSQNAQVKVTVLDEGDLTHIYDIDDAGMILMPYIGQVHVSGKSSQTIEFEITERLQEGYILQPQVSVQHINANSFYILGAVKNPGRYTMPNDAALLVNAIAMAGGYAAGADQKAVELIRKKNKEVQQYKNASPLSPLRTGDTIIVKGGVFWK